MKDIRDHLGFSERTLRRILAFAKQGEPEKAVKRKEGSGRPSSWTPEDAKKIKNLVIKNPCLTARQIKQKIPELEKCRIRTIQRVCKDKLKLPSRKMAKKPLINARMKEQRLEFARQYGFVMFSDESHFELNFGNRHSKCRRPSGSDRFASKFTMKTTKHPEKVMVWGCFSWTVWSF